MAQIYSVNHLCPDYNQEIYFSQKEKVAADLVANEFRADYLPIGMCGCNFAPMVSWWSSSAMARLYWLYLKPQPESNSAEQKILR